MTRTFRGIAFVALASAGSAGAIDVPQYNWTTERVTAVVSQGLRDIDVSAADEIYAVDSIGDRILVFSNSFQLLRQFSLPCNLATFGGAYIAVGSNRVYVTTEACATKVRSYAFDGSQGTGFVTGGSGAGQLTMTRGIDVDAADNVYVGGDRKVVVYDSANQFVREFPVCAAPAVLSNIGVSAERQQVYASCDVGVQVYTTTGIPVPVPAVVSPGAMEVGPETVLFGSLSGSSVIRAFTLDLSVELDVGPAMGSVFAFAYRDRDVIYGMDDERLHRAIRTYRSPLPSLATRIPLPTVTNASARGGSTVFDVDYHVTDPDSPTVTTAAIAFVQGQSGLQGIRLPRTFVEGTAVNLGSGIASNSTKRISWDPAADYPAETGFLDIRFAVMASDGRPLVEFLFLDLDRSVLREPSGVPDCGSGALRISREPLRNDDALLAYHWLLATADPGVALTGNTITAVGGPFAGSVLVPDDEQTTANGIAFLLGRMGYRAATATELACAREGTTPGVQQYAPTALPVAKDPTTIVNEIGFDVLSSGTWVVDP